MNKITNKDILNLRREVFGKRIIIRPFTERDITTKYLDWLQDLEVLRFSNQRFRVHTRESCQDYLESFVNTTNHFLAIFMRETNEMIGTMTIYHNLNHATADIGIMLGERRIWGQGLGYEAFQLVISSLVDCKIIRKITSGTLAANISMLGILRKSEMQLEAIRYNHELLDSKPVDVHYYARYC